MQRYGTSAGVPARRAAGGFEVLALLIGAMWVSEIVDTMLNNQLDQYGIIARELRGLPGIVLAPFLHLGFGHLIANTIPLAMLGTLIAFGGARRLFSVTVIVVLLGGFGTWLLSPPNSVTIGASGLVFGYAGYLVSRALFTRRFGQFVIGVAVVLIWGGALLSGLVPQEGISWQGHLCGGIAGIIAAAMLGRDR